MRSSFRRGVVLALLALACFAATARAQWGADPAANTAVSRQLNWEQFPRVVTDGDDGMIVVWQAQSGTSFGYDLLAARIDALGFVRWTADVTTAYRDQRDHQVVSDGAGGVIVAWGDDRYGQTESDIYAQRVDANGTALWAYDGIALCEAASIQAYPRIVADGAGGAVVTWRDSRHFGALGANIYAQRVNAAGVVQWTADGVAVCEEMGNQLDPGITADGTGGFIVAWQDERLGSTNCDVWAQKLSGAGVPQWAAGGVGATNPASQRWYNNIDPVMPDGAGGAYVLFEDDYYTSVDIDLHVVRFAADGSLPWGAGGRTICAATGIQRLGQPVSGGSGVVVVPWTDWRYGVSDPDVYAQRFDASGSMTWAANGISIAGTTAEEVQPLAVRERGSVVLFAWNNNRSGDRDLFARPYDATGTPLWGAPAEFATASQAQEDPAGVLSGNCTVLFAWRDNRWAGAPPPDNTSADIYAQRVYCDGSLMQREIRVAVPNGGEVWQGHTYHLVEYRGVDVEGRDVGLDYSTNLGATWTHVTTIFNSGAHHVMDWHVPNTPGTQCLLRARVIAEPPTIDTSDGPFTIVLDPAGADDAAPPASVSLRAPAPNPAPGPLVVTFGLPAAGDAAVRVHDVAGRLVRTLHAGPIAAGWHRLVWARETDAGGRAEPGAYWLVLRTAGDTVDRRAVILD